MSRKKKFGRSAVTPLLITLTKIDIQGKNATTAAAMMPT
jgi:hypothetical protein